MFVEYLEHYQHYTGQSGSQGPVSKTWGAEPTNELRLTDMKGRCRSPISGAYISPRDGA